jgi:hypothetical protein
MELLKGKSHQQSGLFSHDRLPEGKPFFVLVKQCHKRTIPQKKLHFYRWYNNKLTIPRKMAGTNGSQFSQS